jgi:hypothetical protein
MDAASMHRTGAVGSTVIIIQNSKIQIEEVACGEADITAEDSDASLIASCMDLTICNEAVVAVVAHLLLPCMTDLVAGKRARKARPMVETDSHLAEEVTNIIVLKAQMVAVDTAEVDGADEADLELLPMPIFIEEKHQCINSYTSLHQGSETMSVAALSLEMRAGMSKRAKLSLMTKKHISSKM